MSRSQPLSAGRMPVPLISPAIAGPADRTKAAPAAAVVTRTVLNLMTYLHE